MAFGGGKVILLGEHAVVYGRPALAAGIARGVDAAATHGKTDRLHIEPWAVTLEPHADAEEPLARAFHALLASWDARPTVQIEARVDLPGGAGLGCSAALAVAIVGAVDEMCGVSRDPEEVAERALHWERVFHGNPSGIDTAMSARGGVAVFRRGEPVEAVAVERPLTVVVGHSGETSSTKEMVQLVARQHARTPERVEKVFDAVAAIVDNGRLAVSAGDLLALGQLMDLNQALLNSLMVSTARLEELCAVARDAGALGAKLTGAGGGGCMIALAEDAAGAERIRVALEEAGAEAFVAEAGA